MTDRLRVSAVVLRAEGREVVNLHMMAHMRDELMSKVLPAFLYPVARFFGGRP